MGSVIIYVGLCQNGPVAKTNQSIMPFPSYAMKKSLINNVVSTYFIDTKPVL